MRWVYPSGVGMKCRQSQLLKTLRSQLPSRVAFVITDAQYSKDLKEAFAAAWFLWKIQENNNKWTFNFSQLFTDHDIPSNLTMIAVSQYCNEAFGAAQILWECRKNNKEHVRQSINHICTARNIRKLLLIGAKIWGKPKKIHFLNVKYLQQSQSVF